MEFVFLGTGTSAGVPAIGVTGPVADSTDPRDRRLRTSAVLRFSDEHKPRGRPDRTVLIDCGPDFRQQAIAHRVHRADAVLLTHNHVDHIWGLDETRRLNLLMDGQPLTLYSNDHTLAAVQRVYAHIFDRRHNRNESFVATLIPHPVRPLEPFTLHGLRITPLPLLHGRAPVLGFRIDDADPHRPRLPQHHSPLLPLAYCTDVSGVPPETWPHLQGLQTLVLDALRPRKHPTHLTVGEAVSMAHQIAAGQTYFVHMSHEIGPHAQAQARLNEELKGTELEGRVRYAYDGLRLGGHATAISPTTPRTDSPRGPEATTNTPTE